MARGKIQEPLAPEVGKYIMLPEPEKALRRSYQTFLDINKAHVLMLAKQGIIGKEAAAAILRTNQELAAMGEVPSFPMDLGLEDIYFNLEKYLIDRVGLEIGGQQHTARSRNDLFATQDRIDTRRDILRISRGLNRLRRTMLALGRANTDAVFSGYTHMQPSEPITFAHYCAAVLNGLERDFRRLSAAWDRANANPLGAGSMGSTTFPIDRKYTAKLLGFDRVLENSLDSIAATDYLQELTAAISILANTLSRCATDLYVWATPDYGYVEVSDSVAVCSSIMPQKKNPLTLEYTRAEAARLEGLFMAVWGAAKNTPYSLSIDNNVCVQHYAAEVFNPIEGVITLLELTLRTLKVKKERMRDRAASNFCTVTELANTLVRKDGISFRAAHEIVAEVVDYMIRRDRPAKEITAEIVNIAFGKLFGGKTSVTDQEIREAMAPERIAEAKRVQGGTSREEVLRQLQLLEDGIAADENEVQAREERLASAKKALEAAVAEVAG